MMYKNKRSLGTKFSQLNEKENGWKKWGECTDFSGTLESLRHHTVYTKTVGLKFVSVMLVIILDTF